MPIDADISNSELTVLVIEQHENMKKLAIMNQNNYLIQD